MKEHGHYHGFNIRTLYYDEGVPKLKEASYTTDVLLWNAITLYYHEYTDVLGRNKKSTYQHFAFYGTLLYKLL